MKKLIELNRINENNLCAEIYQKIVSVESNIDSEIETMLLSSNMLKSDEISELYLDYDNFIKENINIKIINIEKSLWLIETGQFGYDMYDSGVFCAYTENEAKELAKNIHRSFEYCTVEKIGTALPNLEIGRVCLSFNAG